MSVNITVNGKFAKHCRTHTILDDPQEVRKKEEQERRKLRLLQVREQSKKLAKKIREEVNEEKKRELQKLQETKKQELECWRQYAMERKREDYRSAIFQIGTAHRAAEKEKQQQAEKQRQHGTYKDFKKTMAARKCDQGKVQFSEANICICKGTHEKTQTQFKCTCSQMDKQHKYNDEEPHKRKRDYCISTSESECEDEGYKEQTLPQSSLSSTSSSFDSTSSLFANNRATQTSMFVPVTNTNLNKTPAVFLDVEVGTDDSVTITAPAEVHDKHVENNRQFSSVIRVSPTKGRRTKDNKNENPQGKQSTTTTISSTTLSYDTTEKETEKSKEKQPQSSILPSKEKRFTLISDLVRKQQDQPVLPTQLPNINQTKSIPPRHTVSRATSETVTPQLSPRKQATFTSRPPITIPTSQLPRKASASSKSSKTITEKSLASSKTTALADNGIISGSSSSGRVQFYDYNSKLSKERTQAQTTAKVQRQRDSTQPSAMEQAILENQRERERQLDQLEKCKKVEERGQKAMEREQVRRDCNELTEKLEALTMEYPRQVPTSENQPHLFADKQLRKEGKMNSAVEKILNRPNVITCSELNKFGRENGKSKPTERLGTINNELNVGGTMTNHILPADDVSSDSCCSILLGYVDDQSRLVRQDLQQCPTLPPDNKSNQNKKQNRLKNLRKRLDELRNSLLQELKTESGVVKEKSKSSAKEENLKQVIDSISELRKEREQILVNEIAKEPKPLRDREKELQAKEAILEEKVREFYELQKQQNKIEKSSTKKNIKQVKNTEIKESSTTSSDKEVNVVKDTENDKENIVCDTIENPLEIIITVRGETKSIKIPQKPKRKLKVTKSPTKLASLIRSPQTKGLQTKKYTPKKKVLPTKSPMEQGVLKRQNSYDSNSTSYMSLPPELPTKIDDLAERIVKERKHYTTPVGSTQNNKTKKVQKQISSESESSLEPLDDTTSYQQPARINPLIAQYVQRLLGMSRNNIQKLGVSSTDIETPGSTIINTSANITSSEAMISDERLLSIHNFMEENRSFIKDLEESIRTQNNESLENSLRAFDDIWRQRFRNQNKEKEKLKQKESTKSKMPQNKSKAAEIPQSSKESKSTERKEKSSLKTTQENDIIKKTSLENQKEARTRELLEIISSASKTSNQKDNMQHKSLTDKEKSNKGPPTNHNMEKTMSSQYSTDDKETPKPIKRRSRPIERVDKAVETKSSQDSNKIESDTQIARYAKLTENCTHRIAELTELINRVREEKQRLLEVTLSSVSDTGIQSTEYLELPDPKSSTRNDQEDLTRVSSSSEETTQTTNQQKQTRSSDTLNEMPKLSSADKHKQITASRDSGIAESRPITALENRLDQEPISQSSSETAIPQQQHPRKMKPPPTIKRFSPLMPDDELVHELSTILEVDTPATSRINTAVGQSADERINVTDLGQTPQLPVQFPTFEQYVKQYDLDITQLDQEQTIQLQQDYYSYLEQHLLSPENPPQYNEFPSVNAYIENILEGDHTLEETLAQLRISGIHPRNFPAVREYLQRNASKNSPDNLQLIDTESLENITEEPKNTETDTESMDIEKELKQRNIMKNSFRYSESKKQQHIFSSTANRDAAFYQEVIATESGLDKLSTSDNMTMTILETDLKRMVQQWPGAERKRSQQYQILSSTTTSANTSALAKSALKAASMDDSSKENGRPLNLRDFLTRELLKHANISTSTNSTSSDESLRSHFLHSLIGSLTPRTEGASKSGAHTLDRQKTSTPRPMPSSTATNTSSTSSSQLFSGESRISSVHYNDRSVKFFTSDGANADQSSE